MMAGTKQLRFAGVAAPKGAAPKKVKDAPKKVKDVLKKLTGPGKRRAKKLAHRRAAKTPLRSILKSPSPSPPAEEAPGEAPGVHVVGAEQLDQESSSHIQWHQLVPNPTGTPTRGAIEMVATEMSQISLEVKGALDVLDQETPSLGQTIRDPASSSLPSEHTLDPGWILPPLGFVDHSAYPPLKIDDHHFFTSYTYGALHGTPIPSTEDILCYRLKTAFAAASASSHIYTLMVTDNRRTSHD